MNIQQRNFDLKYPLAIRDEKTLIVLDWLLEFRFSTSEVLAMRIGQTATNINRFLNTLIRSKLIQSFSNSFASKRRLYMLTIDAVDYLQCHNRNVTHASTRASVIGQYTAIVHELSLQRALLNRLDICQTVTLGKQLPSDQYLCKPDALLLSKDNRLMAIDYIFIRKPKERIYDRLYQQAQAVKNQHYSNIVYLFNNPKDLSYYQMLFNKPQWPRFKHIPNSSKLKPYSEPFSPKHALDLEAAFTFKQESFSGQLSS